jgi:hypothetical protein
MERRELKIVPILALAATLAAAIMVVSGPPAAQAQTQLSGASTDARAGVQDHTPSR